MSHGLGGLDCDAACPFHTAIGNAASHAGRTFLASCLETDILLVPDIHEETAIVGEGGSHPVYDERVRPENR
jgi:hypothetical protein